MVVGVVVVMGVVVVVDLNLKHSLEVAATVCSAGQYEQYQQRYVSEKKNAN